MPRRSTRRSFGSITEVSRGKYVCRWYQMTDRGYTRKSKTIHGTKSDASRFLAERELNVGDERPVPTVGELWDAYELPYLRDGVQSGKVSKRTLLNYESKWKNHISERWASVPCTKVRPLDIQSWLGELSQSCGKIARAILKVTLDYAVLYELIETNPAAKAFRYGADTSKKKDVYSLQELEQVESAVRGTICEMPFIMSARCGMRVGEACGVRLDSLDFREGMVVIIVETQLTQDNEKTDRLKTKKGKRAVALPSPWADTVRRWIDGLPEGSVYLNDDGTGNPVPRWSVSKEWRRAIKDAGLRYLPMQALRPSFETYMHHLADVPIEKMATLMGHTKPTTTLDYYDRPGTEEAIKIIRDAAEVLHR